MLELIGLIAVIYFAVKFFPDILLFAFKTVIVLVALWFLLAVIGWMFGPFYFVIS